MQFKTRMLGFGAMMLLAPALAFGQSSIVGVVRDSSAAVLPGVTVEAASPALIEKVRSAITDTNGQYRIVDLRPGIYTITFTLAGFNTMKRENFELPASFVATVNVDMKVGGIEESITVSGAAPTVDVQTVTRQNVLGAATMDSLPVGRAPLTLVALTPGVTNIGLGAYSGNVKTQGIEYHGSSSDASVSVDGDRINMALGTSGTMAGVRTNMLTIAEMTYTTGSGSADAQDTGLSTNLIPKEGGNTFSGAFFGEFANHRLQVSNLPDAFRAQGVGESRLQSHWDVASTFGGPLVRDRLWFFGGVRNSELNFTRPGIFEDTIADDWLYTPDFTRPSTAKIEDDNYDLRLTFQASQKDKVSFAITYQPRCQCQWGDDQLLTTTATGYAEYLPNRVFQGNWKRTFSNKLLLDVGANDYYLRITALPQPGFDSSLVPAQDANTGIFFRNNPLTLSTGQWGYHDMRTRNLRASLAYITGTHNVKIGGDFRYAGYEQMRWSTNEYQVQLKNGATSLITLTLPWKFKDQILPDADLYVQDAWTHKRLTLNLGLRYDFFEGANDPENLAAGRFAPARSFPGSKGTPTWHDVDPRMGVAMDLFGNARTAVKASLGRYVTPQGVSGGPTVYNAVSQSVRTATRTFTDLNGNFIPDCDFTDPNPQPECGRLSNLNFGTSNPSPLTRDAALAHGFAVRPNDWEASFSLDHEVLRGLSVNFVYYRRWFGNFSLTDNTLLGAGDYDHYCITAPVNSKLPNGGGYQICGLYDVKQAKFGQSQNNVTFASRFGEQKRIYNGADLTTKGRLAHGITWSGGLNLGRLETEKCFVVDSPSELRNCHVTPTFKPSFKMFGVFPLPWYTTMSVMYQTIPGIELSASYVATNAEIAPTLGRNLSAGAAATVTIPLINPATMYADRQHTVDLRFTRSFRLGPGRRFQAGLDVNNLFNNANVWSVNTNYGSQWLKPNQLTSGRYFTVNGQLSF